MFSLNMQEFKEIEVLTFGKFLTTFLKTHLAHVITSFAYPFRTPAVDVLLKGRKIIKVSSVMSATDMDGGSFLFCWRSHYVYFQ